VFSEPTGTVLLFDGGGETALAVHLDTSSRRRVPLDGQRAGDQPFRLWQLDGEVVVGWGEVYAVTPADGSSRHLASATVFLPAAAPGQLWLVADAGAAATWTLIDTSGEMLHRVEMPVGGLDPVRGLPGGLAVRTPSGGLVRYDMETQQLTDISGEPGTWIGDVTPDGFAWCPTDPCERLHITDVGGTPRTGFPGAGAAFFPGSVWLSPDGSHLAAVVRVDGGDAVDFRLRVYDVNQSQLRADAQTILGSAYGQWTDDGEQFFSWVNAPGGRDAPVVLSRWAGGEDIEQVDVGELGITGVYSFVALPEASVEGLFDVEG
jgi:hypothetical protein